MSIDLTVIVPYYNENDTILTTIDLVSRQTISPREVIFVDSNSTDRTFHTIDKWINSNQKKYLTKYRNINVGTDTPSSSKNAGIKNASTEWVAFMDCGLKFPLDWLEKQWNCIRVKNHEVLSGVVVLNGVSAIDVAAVSQTYGFNRKRPCIPSTLVKKSIFKKTGLFLENCRAGYDADWPLVLKHININRGINWNIVVKYIGVNFGNSLTAILKKSIIYAIPTIGLKHYKTPYFYLSFFFIFLLSFFYSLSLSIKLFLFYFILRGFIIPIIKSRSIKQYTINPLMIILIPLLGIIIDIGKIIGIGIGIKKNILMYFRKNINGS